MLSVKTPEEVLSMLAEQFPEALPGEKIPVCSAWGRVLAEELVCGEYIPGFDRSTVDGYAIRAVDSFGCSEAIPAILPLGAAVEMGKSAPEPLEKGRCVPVRARRPLAARPSDRREYLRGRDDPALPHLHFPRRHRSYAGQRRHGSGSAHYPHRGHHSHRR